MSIAIPQTSRLLSGIVLATLASSCMSSGSNEDAASQWLAPSPVLAQQIEDQIGRLPWTHGSDRVDVISWLAGAGEPAYAQLLELCLDPRDDVAASALAALGATGDSRLVGPIRALDWREDLPREVGYERARTLVRLGDWTGLDILIEGLSAQELWARAWSIQALEEATKQRFGFDPRASEEERAEAVERWEEWIDSRRIEGVLGA